ncbi:hypothetical protein [Burkholderia gladioli]|uniref:hypothetical protein n=1 Tax=Burkholderia gladioli TaxID=28095 RepID=UPI00163FAB12|nr:hypothetical protein [Burkholderia gladioli]
MRLADFIQADLPGLLQEWTEYARTLSDKDRSLSDDQLQNDGAALLHAIVADMRGFQSSTFRENKSLGERTATPDSTTLRKNTPTPAFPKASASMMSLPNFERCEQRYCVDGNELERSTLKHFRK